MTPQPLPRYDDIEWGNLDRLFQQMSTLAMASNWNPLSDVMIIPRVPEGGGKIIYLDVGIATNNDQVIIEQLRALQADASESAALYAMWLHEYDFDQPVVAMWCGTAPSITHHFPIAGA